MNSLSTNTVLSRVYKLFIMAFPTKKDWPGSPMSSILTSILPFLPSLR